MMWQGSGLSYVLRSAGQNHTSSKCEVCRCAFMECGGLTPHSIKCATAKLARWADMFAKGGCNVDAIALHGFHGCRALDGRLDPGPGKGQEKTNRHCRRRDQVLEGFSEWEESDHRSPGHRRGESATVSRCLRSESQGPNPGNTRKGQGSQGRRPRPARMDRR